MSVSQHPSKKKKTSRKNTLSKKNPHQKSTLNNSFLPQKKNSRKTWKKTRKKLEQRKSRKKIEEKKNLIKHFSPSETMIIVWKNVENGQKNNLLRTPPFANPLSNFFFLKPPFQKILTFQNLLFYHQKTFKTPSLSTLPHSTSTPLHSSLPVLHKEPLPKQEPLPPLSLPPSPSLNQHPPDLLFIKSPSAPVGGTLRAFLGPSPKWKLTFECCFVFFRVFLFVDPPRDQSKSDF